MKREATESSAEDPSQAESDDTAEHPVWAGEDVPAWERRFFSVLTSIDEAIEEAEKAVEVKDQHADNPLVQKDLVREAEFEFRRAIGEPDLMLHFELADIKPGKAFSRSEQQFELVLRKPIFPSHAYLARVTVVISPDDARRLRIGSVIRLDGQLMEKSRRSFGTIYFIREASDPLPEAGEGEVHVTVGNRELGVRYVFPFYVEGARQLTGQSLQEYQTFVSHYEAWLADRRKAEQVDLPNQQQASSAATGPSGP